MKGVGWLQVLPQKPFSVAWHVVHGVELIAEKSWAHKADTFLRQVRTDRMELPEIRRHPLETSQALRSAPNAPVFLGISRRRRFHHFPGQWRAILRICRKQGVQEGCSGSRQA